VQRKGENTNGRGTLSIKLMIERFEIRLDGYLIKAKRGCAANSDWFPPWDAVLSSHQVCMSPVVKGLFPFCMEPPSGDVTNIPLCWRGPRVRSNGSVFYCLFTANQASLKIATCGSVEAFIQQRWYYILHFLLYEADSFYELGIS